MKKININKNSSEISQKVVEMHSKCNSVDSREYQHVDTT